MGLWDKEQDDDEDVIIEIDIWEDPRERIVPAPELPPVPERAPMPGPERDELSENFRTRLKIISRKRI